MFKSSASDVGGRVLSAGGLAVSLAPSVFFDQIKNLKECDIKHQYSFSAHLFLDEFGSAMP